MGLLRPRVAPPPVLRLLEFALPESAASRLRVTLGSGISIRAQREVDRVALAHEHFADIRSIAGRTDGERAAIAIFAMRCARNVAFGNKLSEPRSGCPAALPSVALRVAAGLAKLWSVDPNQPDLFAACLE